MEEPNLYFLRYKLINKSPDINFDGIVYVLNVISFIKCMMLFGTRLIIFLQEKISQHISYYEKINIVSEYR